MRDVVYKNLTSGDARKKDIRLKEVFERDGVIATTERRSFYFIKDLALMKSDEDLKKWMTFKDKGGDPAKRHFHMLKEHNEMTGVDKFICKIFGVFYAVLDRRIYTVAFLHSFKISLWKHAAIK